MFDRNRNTLNALAAAFVNARAAAIATVFAEADEAYAAAFGERCAKDHAEASAEAVATVFAEASAESAKANAEAYAASRKNLAEALESFARARDALKG